MGPPPIAHGGTATPNDPAIRVITVTPEDAEALCALGLRDRITAAAKLIASAVTGAKSDFGDNVKVDHF